MVNEGLHGKVEMTTIEGAGNGTRYVLENALADCFVKNNTDGTIDFDSEGLRAQVRPFAEMARNATSAAIDTKELAQHAVQQLFLNKGW